MDTDFLIQEHKQAESQRQVRKFLSRKERKPMWREYLETALIALVAAIILRIFVVSAYRVNSASMEGSLFEGDYIFVNKLAYSFGAEPRIGDIIVFKYPNNPSKQYIKRIVAGPGSKVEILDKVVYVDEMVAEIPKSTKHIDGRIIPGDLSFRDNFQAYVVPHNQYFVLGDNRDDSRDSRFWGGVPAENVIGKAVFVYWSWKPLSGAPEWEFPYFHTALQWLGIMVWNFPDHTRWERIGTPL
jgi:signal peptidase I